MNARESRLVNWLDGALGLQEAVPGRLLGGGNSNVTQLITHRDGQVVLRRPPDNAISASAANGVRREYAMMRALADKARVPRPLGLCDDVTVLGQPFIIVEYVDGVSITSELPQAYTPGAEVITRIGEEIIDAIAAVHALDWSSLDIRQPSAPPEAYVVRQVERWLGVRAQASVRELPLLEALGSWLLRHAPSAPAAGVLHGDFHLDNTLFARNEPRLAAIIDWELATIGDPMADLGLMLAFWGDREVEKPGFGFVQAVTRGVEGAVSRDVLAQRWSALTGIDASALDYYRVFALWRLAAIVEGAYVLYSKGLVDDAYSRNLETDVPNLLDEAALIAGLR